MNIRTKMYRDEFDGKLKEFGLTAPDACGLLYNQAETVISAQEVHKAFDRHGSLSAPMTAAFRLLFKHLEVTHAQQV